MRCAQCGDRLPPAGVGRIPRFCSTRCRVAAHRARRLPPELTTRQRWVRHRGKVPVTTRGNAASSTDPSTWTTYAHAKASRTGDGYGFVLGDGIACVDIDHCLIDGEPNELAREILAAADGAYVEVSPSGTGLHVWGTAVEQHGRKHHGYEIYSVGRYITVTRDVFRSGGLVDLSSFF